MSEASGPLLAPRSSSRVGALLRSLMLAISLFPLAPLAGQEPQDSLAALLDSMVVDSLALGLAADSADADTIFYNLPSFEGEVPDGWGTGVWSWDQSGIMANGANTLAELVAEIPGLIVLAAGDYGTPSAISAFGSGGGGVRVFRDGFEVLPLEGGVVDLARIGLAGIRRVRLERGMGQMRLELWSRDYDDGRPYSLVEAGTGDLGTNIFRGTFADPTALGGSVAVGLERLDTSGPGGREKPSEIGLATKAQIPGACKTVQEHARADGQFPCTEFRLRSGVQTRQGRQSRRRRRRQEVKTEPRDSWRSTPSCSEAPSPPEAIEECWSRPARRCGA